MAVQSTPIHSNDQASSPVQREMLLNLMVKLLREKGQTAVAQLQQKVRSGEGLVVKGVKVDIGIIQQALAQVGAGSLQKAVDSVQKPANSDQNTATSTTAGATGARWCAGPPSMIALAQKALQECETAEPFVRKVTNISDGRVIILTKPNVLSNPTGEFIASKEVFEVIARCVRVQDGRTYLRLKRPMGWVSTRSCRDIWKLVLHGVDGDVNVEPLGCPTTFESRAAQVLQRVNPEGARLDSDGNIIDGGRCVTQESRKFRTIGVRSQPIFSQPHSSALTSGTLGGREEFTANAVCLVAEDGRAYLRLHDLRGWVCERSRNDFSKYAIEPGEQSLSNPRKRHADATTDREPYTGTSYWHEKVVPYSERNDNTMEAWISSLLAQLGARSFEEFSRLFPGYEYEMEFVDVHGVLVTKEFESGSDIKKNRWPVTMKIKLPSQKVLSAGDEFRAALEAQKVAKKSKGKGKGSASARSSKVQ
jgi:hypothetical protein|mmetsp:Transcript_12584/g.20780  ORF Transcript_12584/g.20780 Transcript_12584/m.20780 type:complete len:477 (+) Transcript_12584:53-1483(+)